MASSTRNSKLVVVYLDQTANLFPPDGASAENNLQARIGEEMSKEGLAPLDPVQHLFLHTHGPVNYFTSSIYQTMNGVLQPTTFADADKRPKALNDLSSIVSKYKKTTDEPRIFIADSTARRKLDPLVFGLDRTETK